MNEEELNVIAGRIMTEGSYEAQVVHVFLESVKRKIRDPQFVAFLTMRELETWFDEIKKVIK